MYKKVLQFWFEDSEPYQWFKKDAEFDQRIVDNFADVHAQATRGELYEWRRTTKGRLAEIIVLDQFSRNMFRESPLAFINDPITLVLAQEVVAQGLDKELTTVEKGFIYLPFMHSESLKIHEVAETLYRQPGLESNLEWELKHKRIIERFGRYPHRNAALGRESTQEELAFLQQPGSSF